ncbi:uracil-DNA glycosylase [Buchnera aphidicola]|uniref:uracil-DNA glycosylase n=1 Tax=Buchnera aphidicola TaxID=9 RepID=UPI003463978E
MKFISQEREIKNIFPEQKKVFRSLFLTSFKNLKVVILGQDPYHNKNQADGLAFSVSCGNKIPPSLKNIFRELSCDLKDVLIAKNNGSLENWANQGVLLLNTILTVEENKPGSHKGIGWEKFTDLVISIISKHKLGVVFLLWGLYAQKKISQINLQKHYVLQTSHPSPFSVNRGFIGCKHFSKTNRILLSKGEKPIDWSILPFKYSKKTLY